MRRSLIHFRWINLAVLLGAGVATAVLTGALLVGDSVRGSLRDLALERLVGRPSSMTTPPVVLLSMPMVQHGNTRP